MDPTLSTVLAQFLTKFSSIYIYKEEMHDVTLFVFIFSTLAGFAIHIGGKRELAALLS